MTVFAIIAAGAAGFVLGFFAGIYWLVLSTRPL